MTIYETNTQPKQMNHLIYIFKKATINSLIALMKAKKTSWGLGFCFTDVDINVHIAIRRGWA